MMRTNGVTCAIDVNDYDQDVIDLAAGFAKQSDVVLDILHVTLFPDPTNAAWPAYLGSPNSMIDDHRRLKAIQTNVSDVEVKRHHLTGIPADKVLGFIENNEPQLVVLGTHGRRGLQRIFGSAATEILRKASCPVMILRQKQNSQDFSDLKLS